MHTHNVNSKTATTTPPERWGAKSPSLRMDGFITDITSSHPFDVIRADVVISRLQADACNEYFEEYHRDVISSALEHLRRLPMKDRPVFIGAAKRRYLTLTWAEEARAEAAYCELLADIAAERI